MKLAKHTVLFLIIRAVQCIEPEVCSNDDKVFRGIARDCYVISNSKAVRLDVGKLYSVCDAGVNCREFCSVDSMEWNFFEVKKVCPYHAKIFHSGVTEESVVQLSQILRSATYRYLVTMVSWIYQ